MQVMDGGRGGRLERKGASKAMVAQVGALEGEVHYTLSHQGQGPGLSYCRSSPGTGGGGVSPLRHLSVKGNPLRRVCAPAREIWVRRRIC